METKGEQSEGWSWVSQQGTNPLQKEPVVAEHVLRKDITEKQATQQNELVVTYQIQKLIEEVRVDNGIELAVILPSMLVNDQVRLSSTEHLINGVSKVTGKSLVSISEHTDNG